LAPSAHVGLANDNAIASVQKLHRCRVFDNRRILLELRSLADRPASPDVQSLHRPACLNGAPEAQHTRILHNKHSALAQSATAEKTWHESCLTICDEASQGCPAPSRALLDYLSLVQPPAPKRLTSPSVGLFGDVVRPVRVQFATIAWSVLLSVWPRAGVKFALQRVLADSARPGA
jgi:hypothetical protein